MRSTSIRLLAAIAAEMELEIHQMNIVTAYLHGKLEEEVFMEVPDQLQEVLNKVIATEKVGSSVNAPHNKKVIDTAVTS